MRTQSSQLPAVEAAREAGAQVTPSAPGTPRRAPFTWSRGDTDHAFSLVLALDMAGRFDMAKAVRDAIIALQFATRPPTIEDAWLFLEAERLLDGSDIAADFGLMLQTRALQLGRRCALAAAGFDVLDITRARFGTTDGYIVRTPRSVLLYLYGTWRQFATMTELDADATGVK